MNVFAGDIVYATKGRDKDTPFVVLEVKDEYAWLANGRRRKVTKPKKKKIKHVADSGQTSSKIKEKLKNGGFVTNPDVKRALAEFLNDHDA